MQGILVFQYCIVTLITLELKLGKNQKTSMDLKRKWRLAYAKGKRCTEAGTAANMYDQVGRND